MNSGTGFIGSYDKLINENDLARLYIIKGAPGTGKSTLMKYLAESAENAGYCVDYYRCSSDYESLDCIIIAGKIAVLDGTNPHSLEMKYPGAVSRIVDLTRFFDFDKLTACKSEIVKLSNNKSAAYSDAYSLLAQTALLTRERQHVLERIVNKPKLNAFIDRFVGGLGKISGCGSCEEVITRSVGMKGTYRLNTLLNKSTNVISLLDIYGSSYCFMQMVTDKFNENLTDIVITRDPINPELICDVFIKKSKTLITVETQEQSQRIINMSRFIDKRELANIRGLLRLSKKCSNELLNEALIKLYTAGKAHFDLENIYISSINREGLSENTAKLVNEILAVI